MAIGYGVPLNAFSQAAVGSVDLRSAIHDVLTLGPRFSRPPFLPLSEEKPSEELRSCRARLWTDPGVLECWVMGFGAARDQLAPRFEELPWSAAK